MSYFTFERAGQKIGAYTKTGEHNFKHRLSCSILSYSNGSLLIKPKTFHSILLLQLNE